MNFALDLAAGVVAGVAVDVRGARSASGGGDPDNPRSAAEAINREVFGRTLSSAASLAAAGRVATSGGVPVPVARGGPALREPRDAGEVRR